MTAMKLTAIFQILFLFSIEYSLARPGQDYRCKKNNPEHFSTQTTKASIENKILKGPVIPVDGRKIGEVIFEVLRESPDHVSQIDAETGNQITFSYLKDRSIRLAVWMKKIGIHSNDIIAECSHYSADAYVPLFATFFVDAVFSPWSSNISLGNAQKFIQHYAPKVIFTNEKTADTLLKAAKLVNANVKLIVLGEHPSLPSLSELLSSQTKEEVDKFTLVNEKSPEEAAVIMLTSGSTGLPKGVMLSSKSMTTMAKTGPYIDSCNEPLRTLWFLQMSVISSLRHILQTTVQKNVQIVASAYDEDRVLKTIEKYSIEIARLPNPMVNSIAKSNLIQKYNLQSLKLIILGGVKVNKHILEELQLKLPNVFIQHIYGATETAGMISERTPTYKYIDSVGFVIPNGQVKFVDLISHERVGPNEIGEIYVKSPAMMIKYYKNPEMTKQVIDTEGWYRTGDVGMYVESGEIFVLDRVKHLIKYKNYSIIPSEIESILLSHSDIERASVVSIPHKTDGNWPLAFVKKVSGSNVSKEELNKLMSALEDYKQLRGGIHFLKKFPFTATQKVSRIDLANMAKNLANNESL